MTLGQMYEKYRLHMIRYKGYVITSHKMSEHFLTIELRYESTYEIPWGTEVTALDDSFFINGFEAKFCAKQIILTPESLMQADLSGGYIPVDISNKKRTY